MSSFSKSIVLFDGNCNYCTWSVLWIIKRDKKKQFLFSATGLPAGERLMNEKNLLRMQDRSVILIEGENIYFKSDAVLQILRKLPFYKLFYPLIFIPRFIRDGIYNIVAGNRYKWFGRKESCFVPGKDLEDRFL